MTPLWIDTDVGVDDALAILLVLAAGRTVDGCSLTFGNASLRQVSKNAAGLARAFDWRFPIHVGAAGPLAGGEPVTAAHVLGETGLPSRGRRPADTGPLPERSSAVDAFRRWIDAMDEPGEVLALGPLTNLALAARADPARFARLARVTWMGGGASRGNHTPEAEFNAFADPEALAEVAGSGVPLRIVDLDLCRRVSVDDADLEPLAGRNTPRAALLADLVGGYIDIALSRGRPAMALYDPVAAAALVAPESVRFEPVRLSIDVSSASTRGRTRFVDQGRDDRDGDDPRPADAPGVPRVALGRDVDVPAVRELFHAALRRGAAGDPS